MNFHFSYYGWSKQSNSSLNDTFCPDFSLLCLLIGHWTAGAVIPILLHAKIECICVIRFCFCPANSWNPFHGKPRIRIDVVAGCYFWKLKWKKCIKIILPAWSFFFSFVKLIWAQFYSSFKKREKRNLKFHGIFTFIRFTEWSDDLHLWVNVGGHCGHFPLPYNLQLKTVFLSHTNHFNHVYIICSDYEIKDDGKGEKMPQFSFLGKFALIVKIILHHFQVIFKFSLIWYGTCKELLKKNVYTKAINFAQTLSIIS